MDRRIEKLSILLDTNETQLNVTNTNEITIKCENVINETIDDNSCSSTIKVNALLIPKSKKFKENSSIRKHKCETCKKTFKTTAYLNIHNRIHLKQKHFACDQCSMTFSQICNLNRHKRIHTGEKPYSCDICHKKFSDSSSLTYNKICLQEGNRFLVAFVKRNFGNRLVLQNINEFIQERNHTSVTIVI
jgi:uncharacterized Zn-finger protein